MLSTLTPIKTRIARYGKRFAAEFGEPFALDETHRIRVGEYDTAAHRHGRTPLNLEYSVLDRFTAQTGATATLFVRHGDDFVRVSTSVKKSDGTRAVGTVQDRSHPAYTLLLAGQPYTGYATIFGTQFMTAYTPVRDVDGRLTGARYVGMDVSQMAYIGSAWRVVLILVSLNTAAVAAGTLLAPAAATANLASWLLATVACVIAPAVTFSMIQRSVTRPMQASRSAAARIAQGDLSAPVSVSRRDDVGQLLQAINGIGVGLAEVVVRVRRASGSIRHASGEVSERHLRVVDPHAELGSRPRANGGSHGRDDRCGEAEC